MLNVLKQELTNIIENIDSGSSYMTEEDQLKTIEFLRNISSPTMNINEASEYLGICTRTFRNYIDKGWIPKGIKKSNYSNDVWLKSDLEKFKLEYGNRKQQRKSST